MWGQWRHKLASILFIVSFLLAPGRAATAEMIAPPPPTPSSDTYATHASITIANEIPRLESFVVPTISGEGLTAEDTSWTIETKPWSRNGGEDVTSERAVWVMFRGKQDELDGAPQEGANYALTHHGLSGSATTTISEAFGLPALGDASTPSGTYTIAIAQIPESKFVVTNVIEVGEDGSQLVDGYDAPYTDQDFINWFAGTDTNGTQPDEMRTLEFEYVAGAAHIPCTQDCFSNVLFLPGVQASRLYRPRGASCIVNCEDQLWEPDADSDVQDLFLNPDGTSVRDDIYTRDILDAHFSFVNGDVYKTFSEFMKDEVEAGVINDWQDIPYDWRLSLDDILESGAQNGDNISYLTATDTPYIIQELKRLAGTSKSGKVTIIGHSNGGLLAKALMEKLRETGEETLVDKMIFVGVPQTGTPKAIAVLLHGYGQALLQGLITKTSTARMLAENLPAAYTLLPSERYLADVAIPPVEFSNDATTARAFHAAYGSTLNSYQSLRSFLLGLEGRDKPAADDTDAPNVLNYDLLNQAAILHAELDDWEPPDGVELYEIAGVGIATPATIKYVDSCTFCLFGDPHLVMEAEPVLEGDGTVVEASAHAGTGTKYFFNIADYNRSNTRINHASIMGASDITSFLGKIISENTDSLPSTITTTAPSFAGKKHLVYRVHSPVSLDIYDADGNHTGIATTTLSDGTVVSFVENNVAGTYYDQFGEVQYIFSDGSTPVDIILDGQGSGVATFDIEELTGNTSVSSTTFVNIPVQPQTIISMSMSAGGSISGASNLAVDEDGDGETDVELPAGGIVTYEDFIADEEEVPETPAPQTQSGGGGGGGNGPIVVFTATATSTSTSTPETIIIATATSSADMATTSPQEVRPVVIVAKKVIAIPTKKVVAAQQNSPATNNVRLVAGAAASFAVTSSPATSTGEKWWSRAYKIARNVIRVIIGL